MPLDPTALPESIDPGDPGILSNPETVHAVINELTSTAGADRIGIASGGTVQDAIDNLGFMPPQRFMLAVGSPTVLTTGGTRPSPAWSFPDAATAAITGTVRIPPGVTSGTLRVATVNLSAATGNVTWVIRWRSLENGEDTSASTSFTSSTETAGAQSIVETIDFTLASALGDVTTIVIERSGAGGADTLAGAIGVLWAQVIPA